MHVDHTQFNRAQGAACSGCGANLSFSAELQAVACNFCGHEIKASDLHTVSYVEPHQILPFATTAGQFSAAAFAWLMSADFVPADVLQRAKFSENLGVYIPCVYYRGDFTADWSAQVGVERRQTVVLFKDGKQVEETRTHIDYHPLSGRAHGEFSFIACASDHLDDSQKAFVESLDYSGSKPFDERMTLGFAQEYLTSELNERSLFEDRQSASLAALVRGRVSQQIAGDHVRDVRFSYEHRFSQVTTFLMPVWLLTYEYEGERHTIMMDGRDSSQITGSRPQDKSQKRSVQIPIWGAAAVTLAGTAAYVAGAVQATMPYFTASMIGVVMAGIVMLIGAYLHKWVKLRSYRTLRQAALEAHGSQAAFDLEGESERVLGGRFSAPNILWGSLVLAFATLVTVDVYTLRQASLAPPAPVPVATQDVAANDAQATAEPDALAAPMDNAIAENAMATTDMTDDESAYADPPETMDAPAEPEVTPQRAPVAAMAAPAPIPAQDPLAGVVTNALANARLCLNQNNFDCAAANLRTVARYQPGNAEADILRRFLAQKRQEAAQSDWNAR